MSQELTTATSVLLEVSSKIKSSSETVKNKVVDMLVEREINNRVDLLDKGIAKVSELEKELKKIKPDQNSYSDTGEVVSSTYSKTASEDLQKKKSQHTKMSSALEKAFEGDFSSLKELLK